MIHEFHKKPNQTLVVGKNFRLGRHKYTIKKIGSEANINFEELGHISIVTLPATIEVEPAVFPQLNIGDDICFE